MQNHRALVTRPNSDNTTRYISAWAEKSIEILKSKNFQVLDLAKERVSRNNFESMIKRHSPGFIFLNGHGGADCVTGQNEEILVKMNENENVLHGSVTYALSCKSAKTLGQEVVKAGDTAYIGYQEDFFFLYSSAKMARPDTDETAGLFLTPANQVAHSLAKGHNVSESCLITKKYFYKNITKLLTSEASDNDREAISYLLWDMQNLIFHGDGQKKIKD